MFAWISQVFAITRLMQQTSFYTRVSKVHTCFSPSNNVSIPYPFFNNSTIDITFKCENRPLCVKLKLSNNNLVFSRHLALNVEYEKWIWNERDFELNDETARPSDNDM